MDQPIPTQVPGTPQPSVETPPAQPSKSNQKMLLWVVIGLVVLAAAGAGIYFMGQSSSNANSATFVAPATPK